MHTRLIKHEMCIRDSTHTVQSQHAEADTVAKLKFFINKIINMLPHIFRSTDTDIVWEVCRFVIGYSLTRVTSLPDCISFRLYGPLKKSDILKFFQISNLYFFICKNMIFWIIYRLI